MLTDVDICTGLDGDHLAIHLVYNTIDLLAVVLISCVLESM